MPVHGVELDILGLHIAVHTMIPVQTHNLISQSAGDKHPYPTGMSKLEIEMMLNITSPCMNMQAENLNQIGLIWD